MRKQIILCLLATIASNANAQNYQADFLKSFQSGDTLQQRKVLQAWEQASPKDAELYTCYANYYMKLSRKEVISLSTKRPDGEALALRDSVGNTAGYLGNTITYQAALLQKGLAKLDEGIALYPDRLDMRFGETLLLAESKQWKAFTNSIIKTVRRSAQNKNEWTWTNNQPFEGGEEGFLTSLQDYQVRLYNTNDDTLLPYMREIAQEVLKYYPRHVESLSNIAITYMLDKKYDEALNALLKAEQYAPDDTVVLNNIAYCYERKEKKEEARKYRQKIEQLTNQ
ncbi:MAG: hypothetical protein LBN29_04515 [Mediterranea sp.]|jgi:tetratricopeptide (TPR) repeat protein|nr:hypothetical protein [Mediterranea sp.]